jgi:hypothetical protein
VYAYERAALMLGLEYFQYDDHIDIVFPEYSPVMISVWVTGKKPSVKIVYEKEPNNDHKVPSNLQV